MYNRICCVVNYHNTYKNTKGKEVLFYSFPSKPHERYHFGLIILVKLDLLAEIIYIVFKYGILFLEYSNIEYPLPQWGLHTLKLTNHP